MTKPHISNSQLNLYTKCGEAYRRRYLEGDIIPPGIAMIRGTGVHGGAKENFRQKVDTFEDLKPRDIIDASVAAFDQEVATRGIELSEEERSRGAAIVISEAKDQTVELARAHAREQAPDYQPVLVEEPVRIELPSLSRDLFGYLDLLATDPPDEETGVPFGAVRRVVDFKTSGKSKRQEDADISTQLTFYSAAAATATELPVDEVRLEVLVKGSRGVKRQTLVSRRGKADYNALAARVASVVAAIDAGIFTPALPDAWWCGPKWCGYFSTCPFVNKERKS